jgi:tetratricopeptide (TPR) repeat protein
MLHDLLRAYAAEQARARDNEDERRAAIRRVLDHYLLTARAAALLLVRHDRPPRLPETSAGVTGAPLADRDQARAWFRAEQPVLLAAVSLAVSTGSAAHAWQLAWSVESFPEQWTRWQDQLVTSEIVLAAAGQAGDQAGQAYAYRHLGQVLFAGGRHAEARDHFRRALDLFGQSGDRIGRAEAELGLAAALGELGKPAQAIVRSQRALRVYQAAGHDAGQAYALNSIGWQHVMLGRYEQGLAACQDAIEFLRHADDPNRGALVAATLDSIGYAHHHLGRYGEAVASYREALRVCQDVEELKLRASALLDHLGDTYLVTDGPAAARDAWQQALDILDDCCHPGAGQVRAKIRDHERASPRT